MAKRRGNRGGRAVRSRNRFRRNSTRRVSGRGSRRASGRGVHTIKVVVQSGQEQGAPQSTPEMLRAAFGAPKDGVKKGMFT